MSPEARYNLTVKSLAILDRNYDLYSGWDTRPDVNGYIRGFVEDKNEEAKAGNYPNYMDMYVAEVKNEIPPPATGYNQRELPPQNIQDALKRKHPDAQEGSTITNPDGRVLRFEDGNWVYLPDSNTTEGQ
jgi:hypothetical protein